MVNNFSVHTDILQSSGTQGVDIIIPSPFNKALFWPPEPKKNFTKKIPAVIAGEQGIRYIMKKKKKKKSYVKLKGKKEKRGEEMHKIEEEND